MRTCCRLVWLVLPLVLLGNGCDKPPQKPTGPNVLIIAVDTLRADKLGCYDSDLGASPNIDALAKESAHFGWAYAHAPWTLPSFASLFTSQTPPQHHAGGQLGRFRPLPDDARTIAECFKDAGYETAAIVNVDFLTQTFGMAQGFDHFDHEVRNDNRLVRDAARTTDAAVAWMKQRHEAPFFMMVHYFDPHLVYDPPLEFREQLAAPEDRDNRNWIFGTVAEIVAYRDGKIRFDDATIRRAEHLYDGEIAYTDQQVGRLLDAVDEMGLKSSTVVVFVADHGEEFLDHGGFEHGHTLYEELMHVPLMIRMPGRVQPSLVQTPVGLIDVAPTLCALTGVKVDPAFTGHSLLDTIAQPTETARPILLEGNFWGPPFRGWLHDGHKLIVGPGSTVRLYDLKQDPREQNDIGGNNGELRDQLLNDLKAAFTLMAAKTSGTSQGTQLSPEVLARLRTLGYISTDEDYEQP
ncbi:MAG: sulfatase [Phycisphaerae bacterium]|nr:sulfatase [Phycisphaerae bacterium]